MMENQTNYPTDNMGEDTKNSNQSKEIIALNPEFDDLKVEVIKDHFNKLQESLKKDSENKGLFTVKSANDWLKDANSSPIPQMLFSEFWHENELCILFADTNLGKSILAVQIGNSISKGEAVRGFKLESDKQSVLYFDFELSAKQFEARYSIKNEQKNVYESLYTFDNSFKRIEINPDTDLADSNFEDHLQQSIELTIVETGAKILIIDNLTYLKNETEKARNALPLMKGLKSLKSKYNLSILVLAHTPKRDLSKPLTRNDLQGSKMLITFADSCFTIGECQSDNKLRYIKQIKARNTEIVFDSQNVILCQIKKPFNFLQFEFVDFSTEDEHLKHYSREDKEELESAIVELKETNPDWSLQQIADKAGTNKMKVKRTLDRNSL